MNACKIACKYLERLSLDFNERMELVREYKDLGIQLEHLEKRFDIDKVSDTPEAREVEEEIKKIKNRSQEILEKLTPQK